MTKKKSTINGRVVAHNLSPKGHVEGLLVKTTDGIVQVNYPKHAVGESPRVGSKVALAGKLEHDDGDHHVYELHDPETEVKGRIARLNYALHGEVNGAVLTNGTFVHLKPEGAKKAKLAVGSRIKASGRQRIGPDATVIDAERVSLV